MKLATVLFCLLRTGACLGTAVLFTPGLLPTTPFCATQIADYFSRDPKTRILNADTGATEKSVIVARFRTYQGETATVSLVQQTFPFAPGLVTKRVFRRKSTRRGQDSGEVARPLTSRQFAEMIAPHARMVETKEKARRRWGPEIYAGLSEVTLRFGPDMTVSWVEDVRHHQIISTIRVTQIPYTVESDGLVSATGAAIDRLYGTNRGFRDPFDSAFDPDQPWGEILPPSSAPLENVLPVWLPRGVAGGQSAGEWLDAEAGAYAVEETFVPELRDRAVLEMWLQLGEATVYFDQLGDGKIKDVRVLTYADPFSQEIFRQYHGIRRKSRVFIPRAQAVMRGADEIAFANTHWRVVGWFASDFREEDRKIQNGQNSRFDSGTATARRISFFIPEIDTINRSLQDNPEVIVRLLESDDGDVFFSAMTNLRHIFKELEQTDGGLARISRLIPQIEESFGKALMKPIRPIGMQAVIDLENLATDFKIPILAPKTIPRWIAKLLASENLRSDPIRKWESICIQEVTLGVLYNLVDNPRLDWQPEVLLPPSEKTRDFEVKLEHFLRSKPREANSMIYWDVPKQFRDSSLHSFFNLELSENEVRNALARVFDSLTRPSQLPPHPFGTRLYDPIETGAF